MRKIINDLLALQGNRLFIEGQCMFNTLAFGYFFNTDKASSSYRPSFTLSPFTDPAQQLFLTISGSAKHIAQNKDIISPDGKTIVLRSGYPGQLYIVLLEDLSKESKAEIKAGYCCAHMNFLNDENLAKNDQERAFIRDIVDLAFMQPSGPDILFTATFEHPDSSLGTFKLWIKKR